MPNIFRSNPRSHVNDPFTVDIWDPFTDFNNRHTVSAPHHIPLFHNTIMVPYHGAGRAECWEETPEGHVLRVELPGFRKEEIAVKVEEGKVVNISGKKEVEKEEKHENWHHFERKEGKFLKAFSLPENCRHDHVRSWWENGVLTVTVPRRDVKKSHDLKNIEVKG